MKKNIETILAELSSILRKNLGNNIKIFLYGSYARNDQSPDSDIDILVIVDSLTKEQRNNILDIAWEIGFKYGFVISIVPISDVNYKLMSSSPFMKNVRKEGVVL